MTSDNYVAGRLELAQAKAMVRLGQQPAATAILIKLAQATDARISRPAMAALGTLKLQQGGTQQGLKLLHKAVEEDENFQWPERAEAEADLGLAYLLIGDEANGIRWLHIAQANFEATGQRESFVQCLKNEAAYFEQVKKEDLAEAVHRRLESLQAK